MSSIKVLGAMTGTSCDAIDVACVRVDAGGWHPLWEASRPYPAALRKRVLEFQKPGRKTSVQEILSLNRDLGDWYGQTIAAMTKKAPRSARPDVIANHGQTVAHFPAPGKKGVTLQLGDPTRIAVESGITVVSRFRDGDMAAGGQGAPLVPVFHLLLSDHLTKGKGGIAIHNIGGVSNLTYISTKRNLIAFDTGPGNFWIDAAIQKVTHGHRAYDKGGEMAARGTVHEKVVSEILKHPFFKIAPPKSTGRDDFPFTVFQKAVTRSQARLRPEDWVATATAVTAESIARAYQRWIVSKRLPLRTIYVCGGGAENLTLLRWISKRMNGVKVQSLGEIGFNSQLIEAQAFAVLGFLSLLGKPLGGSWTGVRNFGPPGQITPGANWPKVARSLTEITSI